MDNIIAKAHIYCITKHANQKRKYTGEPYWIHPIKVAGLVTEVTNDPDLIAVALLHDVIEDTDTTCLELEGIFGFAIAHKVQQLTNTSKQDFPDLNRAARKKKDREKLASCPVDVRLIKYLDRYANIEDTFNFVADWNAKKPLPDAGFFYKYIEETRALLEALNMEEVIQVYGDVFWNKYNLSMLLTVLRDELDLLGGIVKFDPERITR